jgi:rod shape-determining protein MreB and related proteins
MLCVPSGLTAVERDAIEEAARAAGARAVYLIEEALAAAIGAGLPVAEPEASLVVDIGGGTTEVAVISLGSMVVWQSIRSGGFAMDDAIVSYLKRRHELVIGEGQAERVKLEVGAAIPGSAAGTMEVGGRDAHGRMRRVTLSGEDVQQAIEGPVTDVIAAVTETLERTPPELSADIVGRGIVLAGGGALLRGLPERLQEETALPVRLANEPLTCVAVGAGRCLDELDVIAGAAKSGMRAAIR